MKNSFRELTLEELLSKKEELTLKYRNIRFNSVIGHVENPLVKREVRRQIARVNTLISQHERSEKKE